MRPAAFVASPGAPRRARGAVPTSACTSAGPCSRLYLPRRAFAVDRRPASLPGSTMVRLKGIPSGPSSVSTPVHGQPVLTVRLIRVTARSVRNAPGGSCAPNRAAGHVPRHRRPLDALAAGRADASRPLGGRRPRRRRREHSTTSPDVFGALSATAEHAARQPGHGMRESACADAAAALRAGRAVPPGRRPDLRAARAARGRPRAVLVHNTAVLTTELAGARSDPPHASSTTCAATSVDASAASSGTARDLDATLRGLPPNTRAMDSGFNRCPRRPRQPPPPPPGSTARCARSTPSPGELPRPLADSRCASSTPRGACGPANPAGPARSCGSCPYCAPLVAPLGRHAASRTPVRGWPANGTIDHVTRRPRPACRSNPRLLPVERVDDAVSATSAGLLPPRQK